MVVSPAYGHPVVCASSMQSRAATSAIGAVTRGLPGAKSWAERAALFRPTKPFMLAAVLPERGVRCVLWRRRRSGAVTLLAGLHHQERGEAGPQRAIVGVVWGFGEWQHHWRLFSGSAGPAAGHWPGGNDGEAGGTRLLSEEAGGAKRAYAFSSNSDSTEWAGELPLRGAGS